MGWADAFDDTVPQTMTALTIHLPLAVSIVAGFADLMACVVPFVHGSLAGMTVTLSGQAGLKWSGDALADEFADAIGTLMPPIAPLIATLPAPVECSIYTCSVRIPRRPERNLLRVSGSHYALVPCKLSMAPVLARRCALEIVAAARASGSPPPPSRPSPWPEQPVPAVAQRRAWQAGTHHLSSNGTLLSIVRVA